jgi:Na+/H+ antiporter NhaD/arsenite permease-like protein
LETSAKNRFTLFFCIFIGLLIVVVGESVAGELSPRGMGVACLILCVTAAIVLTFLLEKYRFVEKPSKRAIDAVTHRQILRKIRTFKVVIVIMPLLLVYALWDSRGEPVLPRLTGAVISLCGTYVFIMVLRAEKAKLTKLEGYSQQ